MQINVIRHDNLDKHSVQPYRFKVIGSPMASEEREETQESLHVEQNDEKSNDLQEEVVQKVEDSFVEKLLQKTDELSSNIIKLQMQIENQENEFEKRLNEEIQRAKKDALDEGFEKANVQFDKKINQLQTQYARSLKVLDEQSSNLIEFIKKAQDDLSSVALDIAKEVIQNEISQNSSNIALALAKSSLEQLQNATNITIKVNPIDKQTLQDEFEKLENIKIDEDEAISKGGVVVLSDNGNIDANIKLRTQKLSQIMELP